MIDPGQAAAELLRRSIARQSLVGFSRAIQVPGSPLESFVEDDPETWAFAPIETGIAAHHDLIMREFEACVRAYDGRLMLFMCPGAAKSTYACVVGPSWAMAAFPGLQTLMVSSSGIPIIRASKKARQICRSIEYSSLFPEQPVIPRGSNAADEWELTNGSRMFAAGILGGIVGSRADLAIIDDPVAGREEADSETTRNKILAAYEDDVLTRLKPGASMILIQTRWHEDDLAGQLLPDGWKGESGTIICKDGMPWRVLCIPAQANRTDDPLGRNIGDYFWPEWFKPSHWPKFKRNARTWSALFQQDPQPQSGGQFEEAWFHRFTLAELPDDLVLFMTGDWAVTKKQIGNHPDYTVLGCWALDSAGDLWLFDIWYGQESTGVTVPQAIEMISYHEIPDAVMESGVIKNAIEPIVDKAAEEAEDFNCTWTYLTTNADKIAMSAAFRGMASRKKVHVIKGPMGDWVIAQHVGFPFGRYDDAVDMTGLAGRFVDKRVNPQKPAPKKKKLRINPGNYTQAEDAGLIEDEDDRIRREYMD